MPDRPYPDVEQQPSFPTIEEGILARWDKEGTFRASVERRAGAPEYVFYDGPPFANGQPHYGHLLTSFVKDAIPRYQTMRGKLVERRFGWDCHGLPAEMEAERQLGFSGKAAIVDYGIDRFNEYCRASVMRYTDDWQSVITRAARWVDFANDYKTMDLDYMESVMWAFKSLHDKGLVYEGQRVLAYCWECETPLSNFETRMDDAYRDRVDPAVTVTFRLENGLDLLVWTTTPWTLPSNQAIAVGPDIDYAIYEEQAPSGAQRYAIGAATVDKYKQQLSKATRVDTIKGSTLVGLRYEPLFAFFSDHDDSFRVLPADFVSTEDGTGAVHMSPAFGEDDQRACEAAGITMVNPVNAQGRFIEEVPPYAGLQVFDANPKIVDDLKAMGVLVKREQYSHSYPHCWRTDTPLIYRAMSSWFVEVTAIKNRMPELNQEIDWIPEHVRDGAFGKWLEGARDWAISRNRFWGSPIPVWKSDDPRYPRLDVYGSLDELERDFGVRPADLHRPGIDELTRPNPDDPTGRSTMRRVEDVLDCWFESGSMPYGQVHYPFENREWFDEHFPADFICEYVGQTRGWFYTLHVLSTALFDRPPFKSCVAHGIVLGDDGRKLSKRLRNFPDVDEVFSSVGADACRWAYFSSTVLRGGDVVTDRKSMVEAARRVLVPIWNAWYFLSLYGNTDDMQGRIRTDQKGMLDRYILAKTAELRDQVTEAMDANDLFGACQSTTRYIDVLNNWYVRRSRERFWRHIGPDAIDADKQDAYDTLHTVLATLCRVIAPLLPMLSDEIYTGLTGEPSVHLTDWPDDDELPSDRDLVDAMDAVREVCSEVLSIRKAQGLRVRLPLARLTVARPDVEPLQPFVDLIADEVNVKEVTLSTDAESLGSYTLAVKPGVVGPRVGPKVQQILAAARIDQWERNDHGTVTVAGEILRPDEFELRFKPLDESSSRAIAHNSGVVVLDTEVTPDLAREGVARDVVRAVQVARRDAGLHVADHIELNVKSAPDILEAVRTFEHDIAGQTLADRMTLGAHESDSAEMFEATSDLEGVPLTVRLRRAV